MAGEKVLVIDDEPPFVETLKLRLEHEGYEVKVAYDGKEGLESVQREKPDLIILDVMMPKLDGFHLCRLLKYDEKFVDIPIIMLTARSQEQDKFTGSSVGADAYITKPFDMEEFMATVRKTIDRGAMPPP